MTPLSAREGYRLWAPGYAAETAVSHAENALVAAMTPPLAKRRLLDAGCGTGRRMMESGARDAVGIDLCVEMIEAGVGIGKVGAGRRTMVADVRALPLPDGGFDVVWCRLVLGHLPDCMPAYRELARVAAPGAWVIVSDFHPAAWAAGHRRSFRRDEVVHEIEHHPHRTMTHHAAARSNGLRPERTGEAAIGPDLRSFYERANRLDRYEADRGLPIVIVFAYRKLG